MAIVTLTQENFSAEVLASDIPVLVDFWAPWCGPCRRVAPILDQIAQTLEGKAKVGKVNVDEESALAKAYKVMGIPTLLVFKGGQLAASHTGALAEEEILQLVAVD